MPPPCVPITPSRLAGGKPLETTFEHHRSERNETSQPSVNSCIKILSRSSGNSSRRRNKRARYRGGSSKQRCLVRVGKFVGVSAARLLLQNVCVDPFRQFFPRILRAAQDCQKGHREALGIPGEFHGICNVSPNFALSPSLWLSQKASIHGLFQVKGIGRLGRMSTRQKTCLPRFSSIAIPGAHQTDVME